MKRELLNNLKESIIKTKSELSLLVHQYKNATSDAARIMYLKRWFKMRYSLTELTDERKMILKCNSHDLI